ncbi:hypothetical protein Lal_00002669 [Lupinus albus]|nr:hypothetical protein Lal_00002669 [Lupinus albus]
MTVQTAVRRLNAADPDFARHLDHLLSWESVSDESVNQRVLDIIKAVRERGDAALVEFTQRFDGLAVDSMADLILPRERLELALTRITAEQRQALETAAERVRLYHEKQKQDSWTYTEADGTVLGQQVTPLDRAGLYVPGGKASYPSSVLMNAIPAKVAGVAEVVMVVPTPRGEINEIVLAAACVAGVDRVFTIGGAQAVAALAYGTESVPQVDKIVGPGNIYVATAKRHVFGQVGIDMIAGRARRRRPVHPGQPDAEFLDKVAASIDKLLPTMERAEIIRTSLEGRGALIQVADMQQAITVANRIAPEHLELSVADPQAWLPQIRHAGAIFMGRYTAEALGDYCAGPNHVLPTSGTARFSSPLGVYDFQKRSSIIFCSADGASELGKTASVLARIGALRSGRAAEDRQPGEAEHQREPLRPLAEGHCGHAGGAGRQPAPVPGPEQRPPQAGCGRALRRADHQVFVGNGSDEVLAHIFHGLFQHGRPLLFPDVTYSFYPVYCGLYGIPFEALPLDEQFQIRVEDYARPNAGIIFPNPNAPTGCLLALEAVEKLLQGSPDSVVVVDEAYIDFGGESAIALVDRYPNLLVTQTLSKSRSLAGLRVGLAVGHPDLIEALERIKNSFNSYPLDRMAIVGAAAAFEDREWFEQTCAKVIDSRERVVSELEKRGFEVLPSAANFVFARHPGKDAAGIAAGLREKGVIVRHFKQARIAQFLRITIGTPEQNQALLDALDAA